METIGKKLDIAGLELARILKIRPQVYRYKNPDGSESVRVRFNGLQYQYNEEEIPVEPTPAEVAVAAIRDKVRRRKAN